MSKRYKDLEEKYNHIKKYFQILFFVSIIGISILGINVIYYENLYDKAIEIGTEDTITALQMVVACQDLSNVTSEEIAKRTIEIFVLGEVEG